MDANLQRPFLLADDEHWARIGDPPGVQYDRARRVLRLSSTRRATAWQEDADRARSLVERTPGSIDRFGTRARWDSVGRRVVATGAFPDEVAIYTAEPSALIHDVAIGHDDVLYLAAGGVILKDLRNRWEPVPLSFAPFNAWRLAPIPTGGVYCLDRVLHRIARVTGLPQRPRTAFAYTPDTFRPKTDDPDPPRAQELAGATWPTSESPVAIACSPEGKLGLLTWVEDADAHLRILGEDDRFGAPVRLRGVRYPYGMVWVGSDKIAVLIARRDEQGAEEAPVYPVAAGARVVDPVGDLYPLRGVSPSRASRPLVDWPLFLHTTQPTPQVATPEGPRPLVPISWPSFAAVGEARNDLGHRVIDSGDVQAVWHRLYLEAAIPPGCGVKVLLATSNELTVPGPEAAWHEHRFGAVAGDASPDVPQGVWLSQPSEIPFHPGLLPCERRPHRAGTWTALIQRPQFRVRSLVGRYLWVRMELHGDGRSTPEVAALRAYSGRRSYVKNYLPELYHEQVFGPDADARGPDVAATPADFLERFLGNFEGILTPIEDRIKHAWLLTDASGAPEGALEWLAGWIGFTFAAAVPVERRRALLQNAMELYRRRGTLDGLRLALDLVTDGGVERGDLVVFEDFRLRRTFATILGANLADVDDPLLPGLSVSGNSFVGDTLFLGDENNKEFLALFSADLPVTQAEASAVAQLFDRLAHRATVLVHDEVNPQDLGLIRQIVDREAPAHVAVQVLTASQRFLVGMSSLVGVDTYLGRKPGLQPVRVDVSQIGVRDRIEHLPSLDPRLGHSPSSAQPVARVASIPPQEVGAPFTLDASASRAAPGRRLVRFHWMLRR
ncbi:phage tail protein [Sorangium sp. So ce375]|uniref:phage tail protein n=1 Tax=Sorangium sp. So ce375 TaxID=3133306 RepID=UPI003F5B8C72